MMRWDGQKAIDAGRTGSVEGLREWADDTLARSRPRDDL